MVPVGQKDFMIMTMHSPSWRVVAGYKYSRSSKINIVIEAVKTYYMYECYMYLCMTTVQ